MENIEASENDKYLSMFYFPQIIYGSYATLSELKINMGINNYELYHQNSAYLKYFICIILFSNYLIAGEKINGVSFFWKIVSTPK